MPGFDPDRLEMAFVRRPADFPDDSVVRHAQGQTGRDQDVFVSGAVRTVDTAAPVAFFPEICNEDWLFFYRDVVERKLGYSGRCDASFVTIPFLILNGQRGMSAILVKVQRPQTGTFDPRAETIGWHFWKRGGTPARRNYPLREYRA
jgi:hypothetical protein